jgi:hypothetical protein
LPRGRPWSPRDPSDRRRLSGLHRPSLSGHG